MTIYELQRNVIKLDVWKILDEVLNQFSPELIDLNLSQLEKGQAADGTSVGTYRDSEYAKFKKAIGSISSPKVDLKVTGDFYAGFIAKIQSRFIEIESKDAKADDLESRYGSEIYGLTDKNLSEYVDLILPYYVDEIKKQLLK